MTAVESAQALLEQKPSIDQLEALEQLRMALLKARCELGMNLALKREQYRMPNYRPDPKDKDTPRYTDFDRRTMLEAAIAEEEMKFELARGTEDLVKERIFFILNVNREKSNER